MTRRHREKLLNILCYLQAPLDRSWDRQAQLLHLEMMVALQIYLAVNYAVIHPQGRNVLVHHVQMHSNTEIQSYIFHYAVYTAIRRSKKIAMLRHQHADVSPLKSKRRPESDRGSGDYNHHNYRSDRKRKGEGFGDRDEGKKTKENHIGNRLRSNEEDSISNGGLLGHRTSTKVVAGSI